MRMLNRMTGMTPAATIVKAPSAHSSSSSSDAYWYTKVASVSEEVQNPDRNIPLGMMLSLAGATAVYTVTVLVLSLVLPPAQLHGDLAPMAQVALSLMGEGDCFYEGECMPTRDAMGKAGIPIPD